MTNCLFCKIIAGEIPCDKLYEDERVLAFKDISAQAPEHFLVIPKEHISTLNDTDNAALLGQLSLTAIQIAKERGFAENGYRLAMNCNADGGQSVFHIHLHCLGGRKMAWPPG